MRLNIILFLGGAQIGGLCVGVVTTSKISLTEYCLRVGPKKIVGLQNVSD